MRKKLRSQQGVAMVFAIVGFVVVMVIGVVFLTAGYANYSKLFGRKNERQDYYTLMSAARYAGSQLDGATISIEECFKDINEDGNYTKTNDEMTNEITETKSCCAGADVTDQEAAWVTTILEKALSTSVSYDMSFTDETSGFAVKVKVQVPPINVEKDAETAEGKYQPTAIVMQVSVMEGDKVKESANVTFNLSPAYAEAETTTATPKQKIITTTYTLRMGDIQMVNGGSGT